MHPPLNNKDVHLWRVDLWARDIIIDGLHSILSEKECGRAKNFKFDNDRVKYVVAHGALRHILADYLNVDPFQLDFYAGPYGKPELVLTDSRPLKFNLSHSHEAALIAVTIGREIGVDIEYIKPEFKWQDIAERFFAPGEVQRLRALRPEQQRRGFFDCWTRKEAYIKGKGGGLTIPLQDFEVSLAPDERAALRSHKEDPDEIKRWVLSEIDVGPDYAAAVAVEGHDWQLKFFNWQGQSSQARRT